MKNRVARPLVDPAFFHQAKWFGKLKSAKTLGFCGFPF